MKTIDAACFVVFQLWIKKQKFYIRVIMEAENIRGITDSLSAVSVLDWI